MTISKEMLTVSAKEHLSFLENRLSAIIQGNTYGYTGQHHRSLSMLTITEHIDITKGIIIQLGKIEKHVESNLVKMIRETIKYNKDIRAIKKELEEINAVIIIEEVY